MTPAAEARLLELDAAYDTTEKPSEPENSDRLAFEKLAKKFASLAQAMAVMTAAGVSATSAHEQFKAFYRRAQSGFHTQVSRNETVRRSTF